MAFPGQNYAPPNVYTQTFFENPIQGAFDTLKIPVFIGEGNEFLVQRNFEMVRGSSANSDHEVASEDETGRAVVSVAASGAVTLGAFNGVLTKFQVRHLPIVKGDGTGTPTTSRNDVSVTVNDLPMVVVSVDGENGIVELAQAPKATDVVKCSYFFDRTDTRATDDVSAQVTSTNARVWAAKGIFDVDSVQGSVGGDNEVLTFNANVLGPGGEVVTPANNVLNLTVDGVDVTITIPAGEYTVAQAAAVISGADEESLAGTQFLNEFGQSALLLTADQEIVVLDGSANAVLGLTSGQTAARRRTFYTFQGPIVDGSNGGVTTTDPSHVTVKVDGVQVIPTSVDGVNRAVTLPVAPKAGSTVSITYYFNSWQDTYDLLRHSPVTQVTLLGDVPDGSSYVQGADFVLKTDSEGSKIFWGTAWSVVSGLNTAGKEFLDDTQVTGTLIDNRTFMSACTAVVESTGGVSTTSQTKFQLPFSPTLGNGRDTPLGQSLFQDVSNGRIDVPVNRPDVVHAYWGFSVQDALDRGRVDVVAVDGNVITLASAVPVGATVYATFWYNLLTDAEYTVTVSTAGVSGVGQYTLADADGTPVYQPLFTTATKGTSLTGVSIVWPSGSELTPDVHFEGLSGTDFSGPVEEVVTVQFASNDPTPAKYTVPGKGPYTFASLASDKLRVRFDNTELSSGVAGLDLGNPAGFGAGFFASLLGGEVDYTGGTGATVGQSYSLSAVEELSLTIDGVLVPVKVAAQNNVDISVFVSAINEAASGYQNTAAGGGAATITLNVAQPGRAVPNYYVGWVVVIGNGAAAATPGQVATVTAYDSTTGIATVGGNWAGGAVQAGDPYRIYNPDTMAELRSATRFDGAVTLGNNLHDKLRFTYVGDNSGVLTAQVDLGNGPFATATALAAEIQTRVDAAIAAALGGSPGHSGLDVQFTADGDGRLVVKVQLPGLDDAGFLQFLDATGGAATDFAVLAGFDTAGAAGGGQTALIEGQVARSYELAHGSGFKPHDRLVLRNRLLPGATGSVAPWNVIEQAGIVVGAGSGNTKAGLTTGDFGTAGATALVKPATILGRIGFAGGMDAVTAEPQVTFYDGSGAQAANNVFEFTVGSTPVTVTFTGSDTGTATNLGPASGASNGSVLDQIIDAIAAVPGAPFGNAAAVFAANLVQQDGAGIRLSYSSLRGLADMVVTIGSGSANDLLGFVDGDVVQAEQVSARQLASALMSDQQTSFSTWMHNFTSSAAQQFTALGLAGVQEDSSGNEYLYLQSLTVGASSSVTLRDPTVGGVVTRSWLAFNTGIGGEDLDGAVGEVGIDGFFVTSSNPDGSGSANTSALNNGVGQDGQVGQTYRDAVTGLTFTVLPRGWHDNPDGPWTSYPTGGNATFRINVNRTFTTDANIPHNAIPGLELKVANTTNVGVGDTAVVETYERGGNEPANGDLYYVTYTYQKQRYETEFFTKLSAIEQKFGAISTDNPLSLAAFLAAINGAVIIGLKQVQRATGESQASLTTYRTAIEELEGVLPGQVRADLITPLRGDSTDLYQILKRSNEIQSSIRYQNERTSIIGMSAGSTPENAKSLAQSLNHTRMRLVYPDMAIIQLQDATGTVSEELVDGTMLAAALTGSVVSPNVDVATPWTGRRLVGFVQLARRLDAVEMNQVAQKGVTVLEERPPFLRVRHGLTTADRGNKLLSIPTVQLIADEVQRQARVVLEGFIGIKFLPGVLSQIEGNLAMMLKSLVAQQIISTYTGVKAKVAPDDPTVAEVEAWYQPVFPLLYIQLTFHLRESL